MATTEELMAVISSTHTSCGFLTRSTGWSVGEKIHCATSFAERITCFVTVPTLSKNADTCTVTALSRLFSSSTSTFNSARSLAGDNFVVSTKGYLAETGPVSVTSPSQNLEASFDEPRHLSRFPCFHQGGEETNR